MIIYPAIDIKDGKCVRLKQGRAEDSTVFYDNPLDAASMWIEKGSKTLHVVDLDGAFNGVSCNLEVISKIKENTKAFVQMGGGIRTQEAVENILSRNIDRVILGTAALNNKDLVKWAAQKYKERIAVSIDALNNKAAYHGWTGISEVDVYSLMESLIEMGITTFVYTDISKDGMLKGPDIQGIKNIKEKFNVNIIASGGITTLDDLRALKDMNVYGAIIGKALYNGNINLEQALEVASC